jgi:hypothetical protein
MLHELVPMMVINIQSHVKKSMIIITEFLFKRQTSHIYIIENWKNPGILYLEKSGNPVNK